MRIRNLVDVGLSQGSIEDVHLSWWKSVSTCLRLAPTRGEAEDEEVFGSTGPSQGSLLPVDISIAYVEVSMWRCRC